MRLTAHIEQIIDLALAEDIGPGDVTTEALFAKKLSGRARLVARQDLVVSGLEVAHAVFWRLEPSIRFQAIAKEGQEVKRGAVLARVGGSIQTLLTGERTALNFVRHLSGIASLTRRYVQALEGTQCRLLDTRKTSPGMRVLEKAAVRAGGGHNHRMGLFDGFLIKDNHILAVGSIRKAISLARDRVGPLVGIEVEAENLTQVREAVEAGADMILLDNMSPIELRRAVGAVAGRAKTEASGRYHLNNVRSAAEAGVDFVSVGALTHGATSVDIAMDL